MKKIYSFLIILFAIVSLQTKAQFTCTPSFGVQYLTVNTIKCNPVLIDSPLVQHYWTFGDGTPNSTLTSPTHTFVANSTNTTYNVCHYVIRRNLNNVTVCVDSICKPVTIQLQSTCNLVASYYKVNLTSNPLSHQYFNTTTNFTPGDSIRWTFGDGTSSTALNPIHTFANYGVYNVCVRVKKATIATIPPCVSQICRLDTVTPFCNLQAYFTTSADSATAPATIQFTNQTIGYNSADSIIWNFGDGTPISTIANPSHVYTTPGIYTVCVRVKRNTTIAGTPPCVSVYCKQIVINGPPCNLLANFTWYRDSLVTVPNSYHFTNTTSPFSATDSIHWKFGDGTSSNQINPTHAYISAGTYIVCLRVIKRVNGVLTNCVSEKCYTIIVAPIVTCNLQVNFSSLADSLQSNIYHFTNQSIGYVTGDSIRWTFGDGTTSFQLNPAHTYTNAGTYVVCLRIKKNNNAAGSVPCIREFCKTITVSVPCTLLANFIWYRDSLPTIAANTIRFTNTSAPLSSSDSIRWTFGDGTTSNQLSPIHVYAQSGTYNVCLRIIKRVNGALTNCIREKCYQVIVTQACNLSANYIWRRDSLNFKNIIFTNTTLTSNTAATALWSFGDGTTSTAWNPSHLYAQPGKYYVCLRIQYGTCVSNKCDSINIVAPIAAPTCTQLSNYTFIRTNNTVTFAPTYAATGVQYTWTFGDGTGAQGANASHTYATAGTYTACLTAYRNNNCASTTCNTITIVPTINCNNITLSINHVRDSLVPNRIKFTAVSNSTATSQQWTITKIPSSATQTPIVINSNNPTYMFLDSGYYNVCVKVTYANGCIKNVCKTIYINQNMPGTNICTLQVYPNPASTVVHAAVTLVQPQLINAKVYNSSNVQVAQSQQQGVVGLNSVNVNIANIPAGIYMLRVLYGNQVCYAPFIRQ